MDAIRIYLLNHLPHSMQNILVVHAFLGAMAVSEKRIILPMGRGRKSVVLSRPEGFPDDARQEGHRATADLGQIHQAAVTTDDGRAQSGEDASTTNGCRSGNTARTSRT